MRHSVALIHKDKHSDFGISFPDFPGCVSAGSTLEEAADMGAEALASRRGSMQAVQVCPADQAELQERIGIEALGQRLGRELS